MAPKRSVLFLLMTAWSAACAGDPAPKHPTGGSGGDEPTGGKGGSGGADAARPMDTGPADMAPASECTPGRPLLVCDPTMKMPKSIKDTGVYPALPDLSRHSERLVGYSPEPALWSDGLSKERFLLLPEKAKIDNTDPKKWVFPPGTVFVKSFFADDHKIIETRFVRRNP
ncbi:MAG TPA: hypothetical protein VN914_04960, partial [Polyangia bacterium]|nr:hypothetical protein [Polyangia bacterium]